MIFERVGGGDGELRGTFTQFPVGVPLNTIECFDYPEFPIFPVVAHSLRALYLNAHPKVSPGTCCVND